MVEYNHDHLSCFFPPWIINNQQHFYLQQKFKILSFLILALVLTSVTAAVSVPRDDSGLPVTSATNVSILAYPPQAIFGTTNYR